MRGNKHRILIAIISITSFILVSSQNLVFATPISLKKARLSEIKDQMDNLNIQIEIADEDYMESEGKLSNIKQKVYLNELKLGKAKKKLRKRKRLLNNRAKGLYQKGELDFIEILFSTKSFTEFIESLDFITRVSNRDAQVVKQVKKAKTDLERAEKNLSVAKTNQQQAVNIAYKKKKAIEKQIASRKELISGIEEDIKRLEVEQLRKQRLIIRQQTITNSSTGTPTKIPVPTNVPKSGVVGIAMAQLGKPYQWGAAGPNSFDCSGLMMFAYSRVGISLPHSSKAQFGVGQAVGKENLQPGDLVFFGSPIHHVGMYIGNGSMVHAPNSGDVVKISPAFRGDYVGARRP